jgi:hypothetical protein
MAEADGRAEHRWQAGVSPYYSSGDYGTGSTTDILYVPLSIRRLFADGDVTVIVPYVSVESDGSVTLLSGVPNQVGKQGTGNAAGGRGRGKGPGDVQPTRTTDDGLGDIVLRGRYYLLDERGPLPTVALTARVKFPTADENRGLGTGEFDEGFGAELTKFFADNWVGFADAGYTFIGKPAGVDLKNQWNYDLGLGYYFTKSLLGSMYYEEWAALLAGQQNPRDVLFALNYTVTPAVRLNTAMQVGLSDGAPDYGLTGGISVRF